MSGEVILSAENSGKPLGGRGSAPNPAGELTALPKILLAGEEGLAAPSSPRAPPPLLAFVLDFRPFGPMKTPGHPLALSGRLCHDVCGYVDVWVRVWVC